MQSFRLSLLVTIFGLLLAACGDAPAVTQPANPPAPTDAPTAISIDATTTTPTTAAPTLSGSIIVFAAASLTDAFEEIATAFEAANPEAEIVYNFAGSQQLAAQINAGAPADVFASANAAQMRVAIDGGRITAGSEQTFVSNVLVMITPDDNPGAITTLQDLANPGLQIILADEAVPVGQYSRDFLTKASEQPEFGADFADQVLANVVSFEENVRSVLTKIALGEGDAGIVYTTDAAIEAAKLQQIAIPDDLNTSANYPLAPVADSANLALAEAFIAFVLSSDGQAILAQYGFIPVE